MFPPPPELPGDANDVAVGAVVCVGVVVCIGVVVCVGVGAAVCVGAVVCVVAVVCVGAAPSPTAPLQYALYTETALVISKAATLSYQYVMQPVRQLKTEAC